MHIAILGTRGIPNNYGGNEQCAQIISEYFIRKGHSVTVYCPDDHPCADPTWNGIKLRRIFAHEKKLGIWGTFIFDFLCLRDAMAQDYDIILELGYVPGACFFRFVPHRIPIVTNMDGLEWARGKWNILLRNFALYCEKAAVNGSSALIADNEGIKSYLLRKYAKESTFIPYGAVLPEDLQGKFPARFGLARHKYYLLIARLEPENNIEAILDGYIASKAQEPFIVVGNRTTPYYRSILLRKYRHNSKIVFTGGIYNYPELSSLRHYARIYFHGHSVGGTNPSLLEAMASNAFIAAFDVEFNRYVLNEDASYFSGPADVSRIISNYSDAVRAARIENNRNKILNIYTWENITRKYLETFENVLRAHR